MFDKANDAANPPHHPAAVQQMRALGGVLSIAEFTPGGTLQHANSNFLALFGYMAQEVVGWHHQQFCTPSFSGSQEYQVLWNNLRHGIPASGLMAGQRKDGKTCWLDMVWVPVQDDSGQIRDILAIARDDSKRLAHERQQLEHMRHLFLVTEATSTAVMISNGSWEISYINPGFTRMLGWEEREVAGVSAVSLALPHLDGPATEVFNAEAATGETFEREEIITGKTGQRYWVRVVCHPIISPQDGRLLHMVWTLTDVSRAKMHETLQHKVLEALVKERPLQEVLTLICQEVERIAPEITATILEVDPVGCLHPVAGPSMPRHYSEALDGMHITPSSGSCGTAVWRNEAVLVRDIANDSLWDDFRHLILPLGYRACWSTPVRNNHGEVIGTFALYFRECITGNVPVFHQHIIDVCTHLCSLAMTREFARQRISQLAFYDGLTGLPNRSLIQMKMDQEITLAMREDETMAVLFLDLDRFKYINESLGHTSGDELLRQVAGRLLHSLRATDIAGRQSGDEFVVVLPQCDVREAREIAARLLEALAEPFTLIGAQVSISASMGIAMFPEDGRDMETLMQHADMAMFKAKNDGRGQAKFFSTEMSQSAQERMALETALRLALKTGQLWLQYQPQVELNTGRLYGVEALARWRHPVLGNISPVRFIPLAEDCGLIGDLGKWALNEACRQLSEWRKAGIMICVVSVNLSATSFHDPHLPQIIASTLDRYDLTPQDLTVEITESVLLDTNPNTLKTINAIHDLGVRLSMDDFGTGYSSLSYLRRLPVSELKLDRSFVANLENDEDARSLSRVILGIGDSLRMTVVAEGVETTEQFDELRGQGYAVAQGYLFARPLDPGELEVWVNNHPDTLH